MAVSCSKEMVLSKVGRSESGDASSVCSETDNANNNRDNSSQQKLLTATSFPSHPSYIQQHSNSYCS